MDTVVVGTGGEGEATDTIIVTQEAVPTISLTDPVGGTVSIDYNDTLAQTITFNVGGSATGWRVTSNHDSITLSPTSGSLGTGIEVMATFTENRDVLRAATITITTVGQLGAEKTATVMITQTGAPNSPTLEITTPSNAAGDTTVAYTATTDSDSVEIAFTVGNAMGWEGMISYGVGEDEFITLSDTVNVDQTGEVRIKAAVTENVGVERSAKIVLSTTGQTGFSSAKDSLTITQDGAPPTFMLTSDSAETIAYDAETASDITFNVGGGATGWSSTLAGDDFITLTGEEDMRGDVTVTVASKVNTGVERSAVITIATVGGTGDALDTMITITQSAAPVDPTLIISTNDTTIDHDETGAFNISFMLGGDARGWQSTLTGDDFITLTPGQDARATAGEVTIMATASVNATGAERTQTITFATTGGVTDMITITQRAAPPAAAPTISISTMDSTIEASATEAINLVFTVGGSASGWRSSVVYTPANTNFITFTPTQNANETGEVTIKVTPTANAGAERVAKIVITPTGGTGDAVSDSVTITQAGTAPPVDPPTLVISTDDTTINHNDTVAFEITFTLGGSAVGWQSTLAGDDFIDIDTEQDARATAGEVTIMATASVNATGAERKDTIILMTTGGVADTVVITQSAAPVVVVPPTLVITTADTTTINHNDTVAFEIRFTLGGSAVGWGSTVTGDFITLVPESDADATGAVTVMATASINATGAERTQTITFTTTGGVTGMITITQRAAPPAAAATISISTMDTTIEAGATAAINLVFTVGGSATGWRSSIVYTPANANFITHNPKLNANETGDVTIEVTPAANTGAERVAKIVITPTGGTGDAVSDTVTITQSAGTLGISLDESLTLYPNPTDGLFFIEGLSGALEVHVHDLLGRQVATYSLSAGERKVDVSALSSGMYVVTLKESGGELLTRVLIKQ